MQCAMCNVARQIKLSTPPRCSLGTRPTWPSAHSQSLPLPSGAQVAQVAPLQHAPTLPVPPPLSLPGRHGQSAASWAAKSWPNLHQNWPAKGRDLGAGRLRSFAAEKRQKSERKGPNGRPKGSQWSCEGGHSRGAQWGLSLGLVFGQSARSLAQPLRRRSHFCQARWPLGERTAKLYWLVSLGSCLLGPSSWWAANPKGSSGRDRLKLKLNSSSAQLDSNSFSSAQLSASSAQTKFSPSSVQFRAAPLCL